MCIRFVFEPTVEDERERSRQSRNQRWHKILSRKDVQHSALCRLPCRRLRTRWNWPFPLIKPFLIPCAFAPLQGVTFHPQSWGFCVESTHSKRCSICSSIICIITHLSSIDADAERKKKTKNLKVTKRHFWCWRKEPRGDGIPP